LAFRNAGVGSSCGYRVAADFKAVSRVFGPEDEILAALVKAFCPGIYEALVVTVRNA
jgi:hypothetical protein